MTPRLTNHGRRTAARRHRRGFTLIELMTVVCVLGLLFGFVIYVQLKNLPVHSSMRELRET